MPFLEASRALAADLEGLNNFRYQATGLAAYFRRVAGESEIASRVVIDEFSGAIAAVADGSQKIQIGVGPPVPAVVAASAVPSTDIFTYSTATHAPIYRGQ